MKEIESINREVLKAYIMNDQHQAVIRAIAFIILTFCFWFFDFDLTQHSFICQMLAAYLFSRIFYI